MSDSEYMTWNETWAAMDELAIIHKIEWWEPSKAARINQVTMLDNLCMECFIENITGPFVDDIRKAKRFLKYNGFLG